MMLLNLLLLPVVYINTSNNNANVKTEVTTQATGDNSSVHTSITNIVNGKETKVESNKSGTIKVEVNNDQVMINTSPQPNLEDEQASSPAAIKQQVLAIVDEKLANKINHNSFFVMIKNIFLNIFKSILNRTRQINKNLA